MRGYRSRSAFKLIEIDKKFKIFYNKKTFLDLGSFPGSWSQVASEKIKNGKILSVDIKEMLPINNTLFLKGDFTKLEIQNKKIQDPLAQAMNKIPDDTVLRAREYRNLVMVSRKFRAAKVAYRRYSVDKIRSKIIRVEPKQWYTAVVERSPRFFTHEQAKIKGQRVWQETLIKLRRSV